jgi:isochorismatase family protein
MELIMEALIIIDMQKGFFKNILGKRNNPQAENNILKILENFRKENKEIIHIQHLSKDEKAILFTNEDREFLKSLEPLPNETIF